MANVIYLKEHKTGPFTEEWNIMQEVGSGERRRDFHTQSCNRVGSGEVALEELCPAVTQAELEAACTKEGINCDVKIEQLNQAGVPSYTAEDQSHET